MNDKVIVLKMWTNIIVLGLILLCGTSNTLPVSKDSKRITELVKAIAHVVAEDVTIASETFSEKGHLFSEKEAANFFETVAVTTLQHLEKYIRELNTLTKNDQEKAGEIAQRVADEAANNGFKKIFKNHEKFDNVVMQEGVLGITKHVAEFIKLALTDAEH
ncbi:uncharacterized protein LOC124356187 isoform X1 [Homalodisca vitripennis]|uniref:uncharacterized protein LOC124356187 isoform X1 n=2 Tax=Homalodisca vitripennis TaxID=197043 RepID=UPI001EEB10B6|nr:uncharacterized protein LOC124356187 isoform X1 [Homalodisca vitripennis]